MALYQSARTIAFRRAYGKAAPPEKLTQEAFEGNDRHLRRLLRINPGERPDVQDLWEYLRDVRYTDIQDVQVAMLARMYKKRLSGYAAPGYTVVDGLED